jgi:hypothetical protein
MRLARVCLLGWGICGLVAAGEARGQAAEMEAARERDSRARVCTLRLTRLVRCLAA